MNYKGLFLLGCWAICWVGCSETGDQATDLNETAQLFELISPEKSNVRFSNDIHENYDNFFFDFNYVYNGGGVAIGDINGDELPDIYFTGNQVGNKLYLNKGDFEFEDITESAGVSGTPGWYNGVAMVDVNADGLLDIYACKGGFRDTHEQRKNTLYINQGNLTFKEEAEKYGLADEAFSTMASFFDFDNDNDLDMYLVNRPEKFHLGYAQVLAGKLEQNDLYRDKLFLNEGGKFTEVGLSAGITNNFGYGLGIATSDVNSDGFADVFVSNDYYENDYLYLNQGNGRFTESIKQVTNHIPFYAMGVDVVDINNDGLEDIIELDMSAEDYVRSKTTMASMNVQLFDDLKEFGFHRQHMHNMLHLNQGNGFFSEIGQLAGIDRTDWSWSCLGSDFDNDGFRDIFISNGYLRDVWDKDANEKVQQYINSPAFRTTPRQESAAYILSHYKANERPNYIYRNNGNLTFTNKATEWGMFHSSFSNGASVADLDNDGDLDLVVNNINAPAFIYCNKSETIGNNFLKIKLKGPKGNRNGLGAKIQIRTQSGIQFHEFKVVRGYLSSVEPIVHFGLGQNKQVDHVRVSWPDGRIQEMKQVGANQVLTIEYTEAKPAGANVPPTKTPMFTEVSKKAFKQVFKHQEDDYDDFKDQILLPHKLSQNGPFISVADVNGDGVEDFFIGGAKGQAGGLYIQGEDGTFSLFEQSVFLADQGFEDMGSVFFDYDLDGDQDLYVVSGGNEVVADPAYYQDRLYINNGLGKFIKSNALPAISASGSCVVAHDFDSDGDMDLFVGGRVVPGKYPHPPKSYLLRNDGGDFTDLTDLLSQGLKNVGMVTSAVWEDINRDGEKELIIVGEWMPVTVFAKTGHQYTNQTEKSGLSQTNGWWHKVVSTDYDQDGDMDFIIGNLGLNYKFKASKEKPLMVYASDFDTNGTNDVFLAKFNHSDIVPVRGKECSTEQLPGLKQKFDTYSAFAHADINEILGDGISEAIQYSAHTFESVVLENHHGELQVKALPVEAQFSTVNGIICNDFDGDGISDILVAGNKWEVEVETTPADASPGYLLKGHFEGEFQAMNVSRSGFFVPENVKDIKLIAGPQHGKKGVLVAVNDGTMKYFVENK